MQPLYVEIKKVENMSDKSLYVLAGYDEETEKRKRKYMKQEGNMA